MTTPFSLLALLLSMLWTGISLSLITGWYRLKSFKAGPLSRPLKVSILIAARNEEDTIGVLLDAILKQEYDLSLVQIIVVDDHSTDRTSERVLSYHLPNIQLIKLKESQRLNSYKKKAITEAIAISTGELIITTDADCFMGPLWLKTIAAQYLPGGVRMISSPVCYRGETSSFHKIQSLEFMYLIGMGAACIANRIPFTCNGANLAYEKAAFEAVGGFTGIDHLASGDDELLLHKMAQAYPGQIRFLKSMDAAIYTDPKANLRGLFQQRKRWASKSFKYKTSLPIIFSLVLACYYFDMLLNLGLGFYHPLFFRIAFSQFLIKLLLDLVTLYGMTRFFKRPELLFYTLPLDVIHIFYWIFIGFAGNMGKYEWKDRMVN